MITNPDCPTVKINPVSPEQGDYIIINETDFDPKKHTLYVPAKPRRTERSPAK